MKRCADHNYFDSLLLQYSLIADDTDHAGHQIHNVFFSCLQLTDRKSL